MFVGSNEKYQRPCRLRSAFQRSGVISMSSGVSAECHLQDEEDQELVLGDRLLEPRFHDSVLLTAVSLRLRSKIKPYCSLHSARVLLEGSQTPF